MPDLTASSWIVLNVGGVRHHTTRSTLTRLPGTVLATMFEEGSPFTLARDADGAVLIDRDGRYFGVLLNFLRHGALVIEPGLSPLGVYEEARFFGLDDIAAALEPARPSRPALQLHRIASWSARAAVRPRTGDAPRAVKTLVAMDDGSVMSGGADGRIFVWHPRRPEEELPESPPPSPPDAFSATSTHVPVCEYRAHQAEVSVIFRHVKPRRSSRTTPPHH